jgi:exodeoxyribonuclease V beta subunit
MTNLLQMTELLYATERSLGLGMLELRRRFEQKKIADPNAEPELRMESDEDAVQIMTIFRSKGLQFDVVYCPLLWEPPQENRQRFPRFMRNKRRHLCISLDKRRPDDVKRSLELERREEDARLLYVALTRAKSRLVLTWGRIKGAGTSPLAHLLHPGEQGTFAPAKYNALNHDGIARHLSAFADTVPGVEVEWVETGGSDDALVSIAPRELELVSRDFTRVLDRRWRLESYSRLSRGKSHPEHTPERDDEAGAERIEDSVEVESRSIDLQQLPAVPTAGGVRFGLFVHHLFEFLAFDAPREAVEKFAAESVAQFQIDDEARAYGVELFLATVSAELPLRKGLRVRLDALPRDRQLREARFTLPVRANPAGVTPARLAEVFARHDHGRFPGLVARIAELGFEEFEGYLRGTIDLAFEHEGRWYVVDYKTNRLGAFLSDYDDAGLHRAMLEGQYYLQYHLYLVAMRRLLRWRVPNLGEDWIGGVGYLFLRGLASEGRRNHGVMVDVPDAALIRDLSALFSEEAP